MIDITQGVRCIKKVKRRYILMKIKQAAKQSGLTPRNIRFYEESGLIGVGREENGYREYNDNDIVRLKQIRVLRELGIGIEDIRSYFKKQVSLNELMKKRKEELRTQKEDVQAMLEICESIEKQNLPLTEYTTNNIDHVLNARNRHEKKRYGKLLTSEWGSEDIRKTIRKKFLFSLLITLSMSILTVNFFLIILSQYEIIQVYSLAYNLVMLFTILFGTLTIGVNLVKDNHFELHEDGVYFINTNTTINSFKYFWHVLKDTYLEDMEFIDYDDIEAVKAGVQEAGMIMGGDYLFKFYLVIFTKDDRAVRLDSDLFFNGQHFLMTLRILHEKAPKWIDPKHLAQLLEMPNEKAYNILNQYYWNRRPWHKTTLYQRLSKEKK